MCIIDILLTDFNVNAYDKIDKNITIMLRNIIDSNCFVLATKRRTDCIGFFFAMKIVLHIIS